MGYLNREGVALLEKMVDRWGPRLGALIGVGRLDAEEVRQLSEEIESGEPLKTPDQTEATVALPRSVAAPPTPVTTSGSSEGIAPKPAADGNDETMLVSPGRTLPVAAKPAQRRGKVLLLSCIALLAVAAYAGWTFRHRFGAAAVRARVAPEFGREVERVDAIMRVAMLVPAHDIRAEKARVRDVIKRVEDQRSRIGEPAEAPANYALGCASRALGDYDRARRQLEAAWSSGYHEPEAASALGLTLGALYRWHLQTAWGIENPDGRQAAEAAAKLDYADPAIGFLKAGRGSTSLPDEYADGLIAFFQGRYGEALSRAQAASQRLSSLYEARLLEGDVHVAMANAKREAGESEAAMSAYKLAELNYREAALIGESDPRCYESACALWQNVVELDLAGHGGDLQADLQELRAAREAAVRIDPDRPFADVLLSAAYVRVGRYAIGNGQDPSGVLGLATEAAKRAVQTGPELVTSHLYFAISRQLQAEYERGLGRDFRPVLIEAIKAYRRVSELEPGFAPAYAALGEAYTDSGTYELAHGQDPRSSLEEAARWMRKAVAMMPGSALNHIDLGRVYLTRATYQRTHGIDPSGDLNAAIKSLQTAAEIDPEAGVTLDELGAAHLGLAIDALSRGLDPRAEITESIHALEKAVALKPVDVQALSSLGTAYRELAEYELVAGMDPAKSVALCLDWFAKAHQINPANAPLLDEMATAQLIMARADLQAGRSPTRTLAAAGALLDKGARIEPGLSSAQLHIGIAGLLAARWELSKERSAVELLAGSARSLQRAISLNADDYRAYEVLAEIRLLQAGTMPDGSAGAREARVQGLATIDKASSINPQSAVAVALRGALTLGQARAEQDPAKRVELARIAVGSLEEALKRNQLLRPVYQAQLETARPLAAQ